MPFCLNKKNASNSWSFGQKCIKFMKAKFSHGQSFKFEPFWHVKSIITPTKIRVP